MSDQTIIVEQYGTLDLVSRVEDALREAGFGTGPLSVEMLAPLDQFHVGGASATATLAEALALTPDMHLLDVGCGLGGPSRHLASTFGCRVTGIDLNPSLVDLAIMLTRRVGVADRVTHLTGDATDLPFEPESFDGAFTQHVAMNIADRHALYAGVFRVLRPGARFGLFDVVAGEKGPLHFPVPWARDPAASFLLSPEATRAVLEECGFTILAWTDATDAGRAWFQAQGAAAQSRPEPLRRLALPLIMGDDFPARAANLARNFAEGRARLLQAVVQR